MAVASNLWRAAQALRAHLERSVLREEGLSWGGFTVLFNLWVWGPMESRALASSIGCSRPTVTGVATTLERRGLVLRAGHERDRRLVLLSLTPEGTAKIEGSSPASTPASPRCAPACPPRSRRPSRTCCGASY